MIELVKGENQEVSYAAANALAGIGPAAKPALPAILDAVKKGKLKADDIDLDRIDPKLGH